MMGLLDMGLLGFKDCCEKNLNVVDESFIFSDVPYSSIHDAID